VGKRLYFPLHYSKLWRYNSTIEADEHRTRGVYAKQQIADKEFIMFTIIIVLTLFIVLDIAALRWGMDSTERVDSGEWERRLYWHDDADNLAAC
jgi:hypothetical protein